MACRSGCRTKDCKSYHDCLRNASLGVYCIGPTTGTDGSTQKRWDSELELYRRARKEGIQPEGTTRAKVEDALRKSDAAGAAFGRDFHVAAPMKNEAT